MACPTDTMVGMATLSLSLGGAVPGEGTLVVPVYNIAPAPGEPAAFAFNAIFLPVRLDTSVLSDGDYGVRVTALGHESRRLRFWRRRSRSGVFPPITAGREPMAMTTLFGQSFGGPDPGQTRVALLTNPQRCSEAQPTVMSADSWRNPGVFASQEALSMGRLPAVISSRWNRRCRCCRIRWKRVRRRAIRWV